MDETAVNKMDTYSILKATQRQLVSDGEIRSILNDSSSKTLVLLWSQLGDFDNLEYAWWLKRESAQARSPRNYD